MLSHALWHCARLDLSETTNVWEKGARKPGARYRVKYPPKGKDGMVQALTAGKSCNS